jgi:hypothetical protein
MSNIQDGGPAFPRIGEGFGDPLYDTPGMSLREWFAGKAMAGYCMAGYCAADHSFDMSYARIAEMAYKQADAMLAAGLNNEQRIEGDGFVLGVLEALKEALRQLEYLDSKYPTATTSIALARISAALAKAEGKS